MFSHVRGAAFHVRSHGAGELPLVQTGALTLASEAWSWVTDRFTADRRVVSVDQRGAGRTQGPTAGMTVESQAEDLVAVLDDLSIGRCVHLTESTGAASALVAAARRPGLFAGLVLFAPNWWSPWPEDDGDAPERREEDVPRFVEQLVTGSFTSVEQPSDAQRQLARELLAGTSPRAYLDHTAIAGAIDLRELVADVAVPVLVVHGDRDVLIPVERSEQLVELLPDGRLVLLDGVGHEVFTPADRLAAVIEPFLDELAG